MVNTSDLIVTPDVYDEDLDDITFCDLSKKSLESVPELTNKLLCVLYLQNNMIKELPEDFFPSLPSLMWLDLRDNLLTDIPKSIKHHPNLTHLLLQNNKLTSLPSELGTLTTLKVLQLTGNPLMFPPREVINAGVNTVKKYLHDKYLEEVFETKDISSSVDTDRSDFVLTKEPTMISYNSVFDKSLVGKPMSVRFNERGSKIPTYDSDDDVPVRSYKKCTKLPASRARPLPPICQSARYLKPKKVVKYKEVRDLFERQVAMKKRRDYLARIEKAVQEKKTLDAMKSWRQSYRYRQCFAKGDHKLDLNTLPYDTNPDLTFLTRADIEKDLPDKYKKRLVRKSKPTVPRKNNNDAHLALKIKELFENLEAIDLKKESLTPRTEQKMLLGEIQKISEIKQKLEELSTTNIRSVVAD